MAQENLAPPDLAAIEEARASLGDLINETPVHHWRAAAVSDALGADSAIFLKLELFQRTGTFKARGALLSALALDDAARARGVTAVSAGNHAIAVAFAAHSVGTSAKVVMMEGADPFRVAQVRRYGAELVQVPDVHAAFETVRAIEADEGRTLIHPFEGRTIALGTATVGLELARQVPALDAVIVPIGGGGLCAVSCAIKTVQPGSCAGCKRRSSAADSLGAPFAQPYSFGLCRRYVDELVKIDDEAMRRAMGLLFAEMKLAVEPAGVAATAALHRLRGRRTAVSLRHQHRRAEVHGPGAVRLVTAEDFLMANHRQLACLKSLQLRVCHGACTIGHASNRIQFLADFSVRRSSVEVMRLGTHRRQPRARPCCPGPISFGGRLSCRRLASDAGSRSKAMERTTAPPSKRSRAMPLKLRRRAGGCRGDGGVCSARSPNACAIEPYLRGALGFAVIVCGTNIDAPRVQAMALAENFEVGIGFIQQDYRAGIGVHVRKDEESLLQSPPLDERSRAVSCSR